MAHFAGRCSRFAIPTGLSFIPLRLPYTDTLWNGEPRVGRLLMRAGLPARLGGTIGSAACHRHTPGSAPCPSHFINTFPWLLAFCSYCVHGGDGMAFFLFWTDRFPGLILGVAFCRLTIRGCSVLLGHSLPPQRCSCRRGRTLSGMPVVILAVVYTAPPHTYCRRATPRHASKHAFTGTCHAYRTGHCASHAVPACAGFCSCCLPQHHKHLCANSHHLQPHYPYLLCTSLVGIHWLPCACMPSPPFALAAYSCPCSHHTLP